MRTRLLPNEMKLLLLLGWCGLLLGFRLLYYLPEQWASLTRPSCCRSPEATLLFFGWNLFLALVPLGIVKLVELRTPQLLRIGCGVLWFLFLPNAPYLISDLEHLRPRDGIPFVFDQVLFFSFALAGLYAGGLSIAILARNLRWQNWALPARLASGALFPLIGYGVYLGREARWNSWNVFTHPLTLWEDLVVTLTHPATRSESLQYVLLYGGMMLLATLLTVEKTTTKFDS